jgi:diketogulonate reductase-like aldo/keto reductase
MPWLGFGTFRAEEGTQARDAVVYALESGYRSIDTAAIYENEASVGEGIRESGIAREEIFVTTKVWNSDQGYESTLRAFDASLERLGLEYLDLYLIHWPVKGKYKDTWRALEKIYEEKRARAIGVSNFMVHHLKDLLGDAQVKPMANQVEFHPHLRQQELLDFCKEQEIQHEAWSPIMKGRVKDVPALVEIGKKYGKSPVQVTLRWDLQKGSVTIPKSVHKDRIQSNADIFDFELSQADVQAIDALDKGERLGPDPDNFDF